MHSLGSFFCSDKISRFVYESWKNISESSITSYFYNYSIVSKYVLYMPACYGGHTACFTP